MFEVWAKILGGQELTYSLAAFLDDFFKSAQSPAMEAQHPLHRFHPSPINACCCRAHLGMEGMKS